jgi:cytochrome c oxidase subunit 2
MRWGILEKKKSQLNFQDSNSPLIEELSHLHDYINLILVFIITFVGVVLLTLTFSKFINIKLIEVQIVEWVWTLIPAILLLQIALPRLLLLYILDERADSRLVVKTVGNQWYWSYEYRDINYLENIERVYNSYITPLNDLDIRGFRLLDVDNRTVLPVHTQIRILITSTDVLHSWTVPSLGVKADAVPGRLNHVKFISHRPGLYFGQCSEICGANHSFMPIVVEMVNYSSFIYWLIARDN